MKKFLAVLFSFVLFVFCFSASSCQIGGDSASDLLTYNKKYIQQNELDDPVKEQNYFIFYTNGTCKYYNYNINQNVYNWTITCKYEIDEKESMLVCFFDSIEFHADHTANKSSSGMFTEVLNITDFVVMSIDGTLYICEEYLKEIPNYAK